MTRTAATLRHLLQGPDLLIMPCCFDGLSARLIQRAGYPLTFMSGFSVAAARLGRPDTGLLSYGEILDQGRSILEAVTIPVIGDGDTGYGNAANVERTVEGFAKAGFAAIMIEDQVAPKRCGHTQGKDVVSRDDAKVRLRAAIRAKEQGADILILARTDARATLGFEEAIERVKMFEDLGADILFLEAPESIDEMAAFNRAVALPTMANMLEDGLTPYLSPDALHDLGYHIAAYPLTLLSSAVRAMQEALEQLKKGDRVERRVSFKELQEIVGFKGYDASLADASSGNVIPRLR
ncbi:MAG: carboxyvinyl-carboxyphosphonate phosphorylmutase [Methylococcus sp.]|nr:MAG: carboxyvinyl-carboxyphosphonate phosphorylmutase [Methylococcus sp.]